MLTNIKNIHDGTRYRIKDREKSEIFHYISQHPGVTRKEIVNITRIRPSTVSKIMGELLTQNMVKEGDNKNIGEKGRPEISLYTNFDRFLSIALYVVSQKITGVLLNFNDDILVEESICIPPDVENDSMINILKKLILSIAAKSPPNSSLLGVGISLTGHRNMESGAIFDSSRWSKLKKLSIHRLEEQTGLKCIMFNTLNAQLKYLLIKNPEYRKGITLLYHWGYGIGLNCAFDGNVLQPQFGSFGEVGHIVAGNDSKKICRCGKKGCLETEAALWSLAAQLKKDYPDIPDDEVEFHRYCSSENLFQESIIKEAIRHIIKNLNIVYLFLAPDRILLTGPFVNSREIMNKIRSEFYKNLPDYAKDHVELSVLNNSFNGEIFGSTYSFFRNKLKDELLCR